MYHYPYQSGYYPPYPAYSNQYAPYPQQYPSAMPMAPYYGAYQQLPAYYPATPGVVQVQPGREFEVRNENPCGCCCALATAAKTLVVFNLFYLAMELVDLVAPNSPLPWGRNLTLPDGDSKYYEDGGWGSLNDLGMYYYCMNHQRRELSTFYITIMSLFIANISVYFLATIVFMIAIVGGLGPKIEILCSQIFMWTSLTYFGWLFQILLFVDLLLQDKECQKSTYLWWKYIVTAVCIGLFSMFNGFVGSGFKNMVKRRSEAKAAGPGQPQQQGNMGEVPPTSAMTMPVAESTPSKMVPDSGTGQAS